jgi:hypothetical protein
MSLHPYISLSQIQDEENPKKKKPTRTHSAWFPRTDQRARPQELLRVLQVREAGQRALSVIDLVDTLVRQQDGLVVGSEEHGGEGPLAKGHGAALDCEAGFDGARDLGGSGRLARGEERGRNGLRGAGSEGCFGRHDSWSARW